MSEHFLENFMRASVRITEADRGIAVDNDMRIIAASTNEDTIEVRELEEFIQTNLQAAIKTGETIISNNVITDPQQAPTTNINFTDLRVVIAMPISDYGAIHLERKIRSGIITQTAVSNLSQLSALLISAGKTDISVEEMVRLYNETL